MSGLKQLPEEDSGQSEVTHLAVARRQLYRNGIPGPLIRLWPDMKSQGRTLPGSNQLNRECAMSITSKAFGATVKGENVTAYTITNKQGAYITLLDFGAILQAVCVPDKNGVLTDVLLGLDTVKKYEGDGNAFGATIGRVANRIAGGTFELNGVRYQLETNENGINSLHSGPDGYHKRVWQTAFEGDNKVVFSICSPDGDQGYPGKFEISVSYTFTDDNEIIINYDGVSDADTPVNMTNHSYWNLNGHANGFIYDHDLQIHADSFVPVNENSIPVGYTSIVEGTVFDFRLAKAIGADIDANVLQLRQTGGFDHLWLLNGEGYREVANAKGNISGITLKVFSDQYGIQFYAGNFIAGPDGKDGAHYEPRSGFALETQKCSESLNQDAFPSIILRAGEKYHTRTAFVLGV